MPAGRRTREGPEVRGLLSPSRVLATLWLFASLGCFTFGAPPGPPGGTYRERLETYARLLLCEDTRRYDPLLTSRAARSPDRWLRAKAVLACGRLKDVEASLYVPVLLRDPEPEVRRAAAFAGGLLGDPRLVRFEIEALRDPDEATAALAAEALGKLGGEDAWRALEQALMREELVESPLSRAAVAQAFFRRPTDRSFEGPFAKLEALISNGSGLVRRAAVYALSRRPVEASRDALRRTLRDPNPGLAAWAARALGILSDSGSEEPLVVLARRSEPSVAIQALSALERIGAKHGLGLEAREVAARRARDPLPGVALSGLRLLSRFRGDPLATEVLSAVAKDSAIGSRRISVAAYGLALAAPVTAEELAFPVPSRDVPVGVRLGLAEAIGAVSVEDPEMAARWTARLLSDPSARVRALAISGLDATAAGLSFATLTTALADRDPAVRAAALEAAAPHLGTPAGRPAAEAWETAFHAAFKTGEADFVVSALDALASAPGARARLVSYAAHSDRVVREKARRLLAEKFGAKGAELPEAPRATERPSTDYWRLARLANETLLSATVTTRRGEFEIELLAEVAPMTVENFASLADRGFFARTTFHRVVPDFVVQGGDPRGDGTGGPGYAIQDELSPARYERGTVGMALSGPDTGGSQWFATLSAQPHLDGAYTVFGRVTRGMEVLDLIEQDDPILAVHMKRRAREERPAGFLP